VIHLTIPIDPVAWGRVKRGAYGQAYVPAKTRSYERTLAQLARKTYGGEPLKGPLALKLTFILRTPKRPKFPQPAVRPDLDNYVKAVKDAMSGVLWIDDGQICDLVASKFYDVSTGGGPRVDIQVRQLGSDHLTKPDFKQPEGGA
jgi:Holliday junction resolvase RusA-like endonuclease